MKKPEFFCTRLKRFLANEECVALFRIQKYIECKNCITGQENSDKNLEHHNKPEIKNMKPDEKISIQRKEKTKRCCRCKEYKSLSKFHRNKRTKDGLQWHCTDCSKLYNEEQRRENFTRRVVENEKNIEKCMVVVDFKNHKDLLDKLVESSRVNFRLLENEILYMLNIQIQQQSNMHKHSS